MNYRKWIENGRLSKMNVYANNLQFIKTDNKVLYVGKLSSKVCMLSSKLFKFTGKSYKENIIKKDVAK